SMSNVVNDRPFTVFPVFTSLPSEPNWISHSPPASDLPERNIAENLTNVENIKVFEIVNSCLSENCNLNNNLYIYIFLGDSTGLDLCSIHSNATLLRYYSSVISYGYLGDVLRDSENFRWMGPKRYEYSGFKKFMANHGYEGEVTLLADSCRPSTGPKCIENCSRCQMSIINPECEWKTFRGRFFMVNGANVSCACTRSPNGISPYCHLGDGCVDVLLIKHTNLFNNLRLLLRLSSKEKNKNVFDLPFVEVHRAREFTFRALPKPVSPAEFPPPRLIPGVSVWNCDGEVQWETNIRIRVHCQLLQVFTRRVQETDEEESCKMCPF
ncbi:hypothetical protein L9F63_024453, partial [Diploptera punctata]